MTNHKPKLGDKVRCKITGFEGVIVSHATHLAGCDRMYVEPRVGDDGKYTEGRWFDIDMLDIVEAGSVERVEYTVKDYRPGGADIPPSR